MKNLMSFFFLLSCLFIFSNCKKVEINTVSYLRSNQMNERGRVDGVSLPLWRETCDKPNGFCYGSSIKVDWAIVDDILDEIGYTTVTVRDSDKIRFKNEAKNVIDQSILLEQIESDLTSGSASEVANSITNNFDIPEETSFSEEDSKRLLKDAEIDGTKITMMPGEYPIIVNDENPFGFFDVNIKIE